MHGEDRTIDEKIDRMLTVKEVSQLLHVHPNTLRRWSDRGIIKTFRIGTRTDRRFRQDDVTTFITQIKGNGSNPTES